MTSIEQPNTLHEVMVMLLLLQKSTTELAERWEVVSEPKDEIEALLNLVATYHTTVASFLKEFDSIGKTLSDINNL